MKKGLLFLPLLASFALGGCDLFGGGDDNWIVKPEITGGTKAEKNAILTAVNNLSVCTLEGQDLFPVSKSIRLYEDEQHYIRVLNKVKVEDKTVNIEWDLQKKQSTFDAVVSPDKGVTSFVYIKYPGHTGSDSVYKWGIKKITCGGATSTKANFDLKATVVHGTHPWTPMTIPQILAVTDDGVNHEYTVDGVKHTFESISNIVDYEAKYNNAYSPWWNAPAFEDDEGEKRYFEAEVKGKIVFLSEDGNWGLLQNGDHVIELYSGSELDLDEEHYPELKNKYVSIKGEVGTGYGNFQLSFIKSIRAIDSSQVTEPTTSFKSLTNTVLGNAKLRSDPGTAKAKFRYKQFTNQFEHNQLVTLTGTVTTAKVNDGSNGRFLIGITPTDGTHEVYLAYDYHTDIKSHKVRDAILAKYTGKGCTMTVKGTIRFTDGVQDRHKAPLVLEGAGPKNGTWNIVPFDVSHIA